MVSNKLEDEDDGRPIDSQIPIVSCASANCKFENDGKMKECLFLQSTGKKRSHFWEE